MTTDDATKELRNLVIRFESLEIDEDELVILIDALLNQFKSDLCKKQRENVLETANTGRGYYNMIFGKEQILTAKEPE